MVLLVWTDATHTHYLAPRSGQRYRPSQPMARTADVVPLLPTRDTRSMPNARSVQMPTPGEEMSRYSYKVSVELADQGAPFDSYIMAAMRTADSINFELLAEAFPVIRAELQERYEAPGGYLGNDQEES